MRENPSTISLITATFNVATTISSTLESVLAQSYAPIEHIIIDGKSTDSTLEIIESYRLRYESKGITLRVVSERDSGLYDAMNKGLSLANGDVVGFLNADDFLASKNVIALVAWGFAKPTHDIQIIYADVEYVNENLQTIRTLNGKILSKNAFRLGFHPAHPSFYAKKELFLRYGGFKLKYKIASDYELMLRFLQKYHLKSLYIQECFVKMRIGGVSNASLKNILRANKECFESWQDNQLSTFPIFVILKPFFKIFSVNIAALLKEKFTRWRGGGVESRHIFSLFASFFYLDSRFFRITYTNQYIYCNYTSYKPTNSYSNLYIADFDAQVAI